jgi:hypothetical protein
MDHFSKSFRVSQTLFKTKFDLNSSSQAGFGLSFQNPMLV